MSKRALCGECGWHDGGHNPGCSEWTAPTQCEANRLEEEQAKRALEIRSRSVPEQQAEGRDRIENDAMTVEPAIEWKSVVFDAIPSAS